MLLLRKSNLVAEEIGDLDKDGILHKSLMASDEVFLNIVDDLPLTSNPRITKLFLFLCDFWSIKIIPGLSVLSVLAHVIQLCSEARRKIIYI